MEVGLKSSIAPCMYHDYIICHIVNEYQNKTLVAPSYHRYTQKLKDKNKQT